MRIITVDDEMASLDILTEEVRKILPEAQMADFMDSSDALEYVKRERVDIAFLDVEMPELDGIELARRLKRLNPVINIIFVTAFPQYSLDAMQLYASAYLLKPVEAENIREALQNLRNKIPGGEREIRAVTFGNFDLLVDGRAVHFGRKKSKEMLAYLIDRHGRTVTRKELAAVLFEDAAYSRGNQNYIGKIVAELKNSLDAVGAGDIYIHNTDAFAVDTSRFTCDLYEYEEGSAPGRQAYHGEYMAQYSWGENRRGFLARWMFVGGEE